LGLSAQKFGFIPESMSDSIFAIYAEELGFLGCAFLILLLIFFTIYAFSSARKAELFPKLLAIGIATWIIVQSFINIAAMTGLLPISGTPLPFLSYGGTHLIFELIALGLLLNVSKTVNNN
ncbi:MAG: FtsW/RodA/SpoVE family cell cycle protein, partial [Candidatus Pacebacteria bacterium]|nr:FtsW/RodA/SpoVE family cell cycle protein [Candidatus Paceibacterota bacterium]